MAKVMENRSFKHIYLGTIVLCLQTDLKLRQKSHQFGRSIRKWKLQPSYLRDDKEREMQKLDPNSNKNGCPTE